jgi:hypothetical protein
VIRHAWALAHCWLCESGPPHEPTLAQHNAFVAEPVGKLAKPLVQRPPESNPVGCGIRSSRGSQCAHAAPCHQRGASQSDCIAAGDRSREIEQTYSGATLTNLMQEQTCPLQGLRPMLLAWRRNRNRRNRQAGTSTRSRAKHMLGTLEASDEATAMEKAAAEFKVPAD